jgi:hypothetical protein
LRTGTSTETDRRPRSLESVDPFAYRQPPATIVAFLNAVARSAVEQREEKRGLLGRRKRPPEVGQRPK